MTPADKTSTPDGRHYSYAAYATRSMAEEFDARRFGGPIGGLLAETQERVLLSFLGDVRGRRILDVGTGTGRAALALARQGADVTGVDASNEMLDMARQRAAAAAVVVAFEQGDAHQLAFPDRAFDAAVSLRVLMHTPDWRRCLGELCRVAGERVVFDFPSSTSVAALESGWRRLMARIGRATEAYRVFREAAMTRELARHGFRVAQVHRQFVLPIALHKTIGSRAITERVEGMFDAAGLLRHVGSPVTVVAER